MLKFKNILFWSFVVLALAGAVYAYFAIKKSKKPQVDALAVLPDSCLVYVNTGNFFELNNKIRSQSLIADKLKLFSEINVLCENLQVLDSLFTENEELKEELADNPVHFALYSEKPEWLATFNIKQLGDQENVSEWLSKTLNAKAEENNIYAFRHGKNFQFYFHLNAGIVSIASSTALITKSHNASLSKFINSASYKEFKATLSEDKLLSIYINHALYSNSSLTQRLNLSALCHRGFSAGQIDLEPSGLKVNGFLNPDSTETIHALVNQESQNTADMLDILPYNIIGFKAYGFNSFASLALKSERFTKKINSNFWSKANDVAMFNLRKEFNENIKNHLVAFETAVSQHGFIAAEITDTVKAINHLRFMSDTVLSTNGYAIYRLNTENKPLNLFEPLLITATTYCALKNSHIIFAATPDELLLLLDNIDHAQLASTNESFNYYRGQHFPDSYNYLVYSSPSANKKMIPSFFNFSASGKKDPFENLKHFSYSLVNDANAFKFRLQVLNEAESNARQENVLWTLLLDTLSDMKPAAFVNHLNGENEIVVQDVANTLYLVSAKGTVLWKKNLEEKILSEIYRVDVFGNHKFQFLFNTKNHIHLLDRNGKYVKGYPINLPAEATSQMSLIQYINDKDKSNPDEKDLRLFIACADKAIYNYNIHAEAPEGFIPVKTEHEVNLPVQYIKVGKSDYLVALDKEGKIYTFSRKGEGRIGLKNRTLANCSAFYVDAANSIANTHLICVDDKSGLINKIKFIDEKELIKVNMEHGSADVQFSLIDDNRDMDLVITRNSNIQAFNFHGDLLFEKNLGTELSNTTYYSDESHSFYCSINSTHSELLVFDVAKQKVKKIKAGAMPLVISLFNDNKKYLVVTNGNQLSCLPLD